MEIFTDVINEHEEDERLREDRHGINNRLLCVYRDVRIDYHKSRISSYGKIANEATLVIFF